LVQTFPFELGHCGLFAGISHGEQHQQFFMWGTTQEHPQTRATVERSGSDCHQPYILKQERKEVHLKLRYIIIAVLPAWGHCHLYYTYSSHHFPCPPYLLSFFFNHVVARIEEEKC
jgi:hypothetical protein